MPRVLMTPLVLVGIVLSAPDGGGSTSPHVLIAADRLEVFKKESRAIYLGHAKAERGTLTLTCDRLEVFFGPTHEVERIMARGSVAAVDGDRRAWGEEAEFVNQTGVLTVRGKPRAQQGEREVEGEVIAFTSGIDRLEVTQARTRVKAPSDQQVAIDADQMTLEGPKGEAKWAGHVRARRAKVLLLAPELIALYDERGEITRMRARGGVEVTEGDRWAQGQAAEYDVLKGVLVVTGKPQAKQGKSRMKGSKVTFFSGSEFLEVEDATTVIETEPRKGK